MNNYPNFVASKLKPAGQVIDTLNSDKMDLLHCAVGLSGESGEVLDMVKKHVFNNREMDKGKLIEELGDCLFYLTGLMNVLGVDMDDVIQMNVLKLDARYRDGYSDKAAAERRDES